MVIVKSVNQVPIRLTQERWSYIIRRHPEIENQKKRILETLSEPGLIQKGDFGELLATRLYKNTPLTTKFLVVVYKEIAATDGFVITAYFTNKPSERREVIWKP